MRVFLCFTVVIAGAIALTLWVMPMLLPGDLINGPRYGNNPLICNTTYMRPGYTHSASFLAAIIVKDPFGPAGVYAVFTLY